MLVLVVQDGWIEARDGETPILIRDAYAFGIEYTGQRSDGRGQNPKSACRVGFNVWHDRASRLGSTARERLR